jgi:hypothetical protein
VKQGGSSVDDFSIKVKKLPSRLLVTISQLSLHFVERSL